MNGFASSVPAGADLSGRRRFGNYVQAVTTATHKDMFDVDGCLAIAVRAGLLSCDLCDRVRAHVYAAQALASESAGLVLEGLALVPTDKQADENSEHMLRNVRSALRDILVHHLCAGAGGFDSKRQFIKLLWELASLYPAIFPPHRRGDTMTCSLSSQLQNAYVKLLQEYHGWLTAMNFKDGKPKCEMNVQDSATPQDVTAGTPSTTMSKSKARIQRKKARDAIASAVQIDSHIKSDGDSQWVVDAPWYLSYTHNRLGITVIRPESNDLTYLMDFFGVTGDVVSQDTFSYLF